MDGLHRLQELRAEEFDFLKRERGRSRDRHDSIGKRMDRQIFEPSAIARGDPLSDLCLDVRAQWQAGGAIRRADGVTPTPIR